MINKTLSRKQFHDLYPSMYPNKSIRSVTFIVTNDCNLACSYCYQHNKCSNKMSLETAKKCVDMLFKQDAENSQYINDVDAHGLIIDFIGGEPLLEIELIDTTMDYFREKAMELNHRWAVNYMITISTNGTLYNNSAVQLFLEKNNGRVSMSVTIDGNKEAHDSCRVFKDDGSGSYDIASKAFKDIYTKYNQTGTKYTIAPANLKNYFDACVYMIEEFNLESLFSNCVYEEGWTIEHAKEFYIQLKKTANWVIENNKYQNLFMSIFEDYIGRETTEEQNWCGGTGKMLSFDTDGKIYPCLRYAPSSVGDKVKPLVIGDCENGIEKTCDQKQIVDKLRAITRSSQSPQKCLDCKIATGCGWCSAYNYEDTGVLNKRVTYICDMHKARVLATSYYRNMIAIKENSKDFFPVNLPKELAIEIISEDEYDMLVNLSQGIIT